ncbi:inosine/xanthosine triphosphatase [Halorubrum aquaticum]|uniref:Probable inosine/xanthosine triphosphatase n=1 Tax=Halorubrum aquaticum TaxID=387340 RepID=A0A1I3B286_9EURY|nr:inosine/xanthosine triphosphatase [Halorubrum aquaticum]SFH56404.1 inosine/xanthosine triphosphatase [Halorubrum aquaticum]
MRVGVGSGNPVKRRAVERALGTNETESVESVAVPSGVSEQPTGHAETVAGAENRAAAVLEAGGYDLGVGLEGGVARFEGVDGLFLVMWAAVDDGDRVGRGSGPSLRLPDGVADRVDAGGELGPIMDDVLDTTGVARRGGAAGALTNGGLDRTDALAAAVSGALGPFVSDLY